MRYSPTALGLDVKTHESFQVPAGQFALQHWEKVLLKQLLFFDLAINSAQVKGPW